MQGRPIGIEGGQNLETSGQEGLGGALSGPVAGLGGPFDPGQIGSQRLEGGSHLLGQREGVTGTGRDPLGQGQPRLPDPCHFRSCRQGQGQAGPPSGDHCRHPGRLGPDAAIDQRPSQIFVGNSPEVHSPATTGDGRREIVLGLGRHQKDHRCSGLLQRLQQSVGRLFGHEACILEEKHPLGGLDR